MGKHITTTLLRALLRRKPIERSPITQTRLDRCLTTLDLTTLGIGSTLGLGVYVLAGQVAATKAGPAVTISFFIAAVASVFAGLCYAEFGARVPKAGSAYVYSYITVGEFMAFVIGWNLILEYAIGSSAIARGYSGYVDSLIDGKMQKFFTKYFPLDFGISPYFDFFAFSIAMLVAALLSVGVKKSTRLNAIFTVMNLLGVVYAIICGSFKIDIKNWELDPKDSEQIPDPKTQGDGGFFPYGFSGMMAGAATCFYGFVGFDMIATTGEEVKNPARSIPLAIVFSLLVIFLSYCGVSAVQTLMWPYWDQNQLAPLPYVFKMVGYPFAQWILTAGAMAGLYSSLLGTMYPLTRVFYAMGNDRMIFKFLALVHHKLKTPLWATFFSGIFSGIMAALFDFQQLCDMMSIGTLLAYTLVAVSVLILRFQKTNFAEDDQNDSDLTQELSDDNDDSEQLLDNSNSGVWSRIFNLNNEIMITAQTSKMSTIIVSIMCVIALILSILLTFLQKLLFHLNYYALSSVLITIIVLAIVLTALKRQPQTNEKMSFKVPYVPLIPCLSIFVNFYLMLNLSKLTWIRFGIWMFLGLLMYFLYGIIESVGYLSDDQRNKLQSKGESKSASRKASVSSLSLSPSTSSSGISSNNIDSINRSDDLTHAQISVISIEQSANDKDTESESVMVNDNDNHCTINDNSENNQFNNDTHKLYESLA